MRKKRNSFSFLIYLMTLLFVMSFGLAVTWVGSNVDYQVYEDVSYYHNLSANVTNFDSDITFVIDTDKDINWTNSTGTYQVSADDVSDWIRIYDSVTGNLTINATLDSHSGYFVVPIQAINSSVNGNDVTTDFEFMINATNDFPNFTLESNYSIVIPYTGNTSINITLTGSDEEGHYPLSYNVSMNNCSFAKWSTRTNANCSLNTAFYEISDTTSIMNFWNLTHNDVGVYNMTVCVTDNVSLGSLPLYRDSDYDNNKTTCYNSTLDLRSSLSINISDCNNTNWTEGQTLNCTINITTIGATDLITITTDAKYENHATTAKNTSWFYSDNNINAQDFTVSVNISTPLTKREVGYWKINFTADDGDNNLTRPVFEEVYVFVNFTQDPVDLRPIGDLTGGNALYESYNFQVNVSDDDLLIWDYTFYKENFTMASNVSWVDVTVNNAGNSDVPYRLKDVYINHTEALNSLGVGTYSVRINVNDTGDNTDFEDFLVEIANTSAPQWNVTLPAQVDLNLTEDSAFYYNFSKNVTDADAGDTITFYYEVNNGAFCSFNSTTFTTEGIASLMPEDCDVGYHNVTVIASDGKLNSSKLFNFSVNNVVDLPSIASLNSNYETEESNLTTIDFQVNDDDFLIEAFQSSYYLENITVNVTIENLTTVATPISLVFVNITAPISSTQFFRATFTPDEQNVGDYNVTVNITDTSGAWDAGYFILNITQVNDPPNLSFIPNQTRTSLVDFYYDFNATDEEDSPTLPESGLLTYSIQSLTAGGDFLNINTTTGVINQSMNESVSGFFEYNLSVTDSDSGVDWQVFSLTVYGSPNVTLPESSYEFNWDEGEIEYANFTIDYSVNSTNLSYMIYMDKIQYINSTDYNYTSLILRDSGEFSWNSSNNLSWNYSVLYDDETYGLLKNLTMVVYHTDYPELNDTQNWKINITHTNENISFSGFIPKQGPVTAGSTINLDLSQFFSDADYSDLSRNQRIDFEIVTNSNSTNNVESSSTLDGWTYQLTTSAVVTEIIKIVATEYDDLNNSLGNASSNEFEVEFISPDEVEVPTTRRSTVVKLQHFSLKLIVPQDIILKDKNYIEVPFSLQNTGTVALNGINLDSDVLFNNAFSDDISIELEETYLPSLGVGQIENYTLRVNANTERSGRYKVTVRANVTSPKFSDWGDFFIELQKTNDSEVEQILIFTEQFITDNPECLELTEVFNRATEAYEIGDTPMALSLANEVTTACEDAISASEQVRYNVEGFVQRNFYYILFSTLIVFVVGFVIYVYKRVRFNKYEGDYILR